MPTAPRPFFVHERLDQDGRPREASGAYVEGLDEAEPLESAYLKRARS